MHVRSTGSAQSSAAGTRRLLPLFMTLLSALMAERDTNDDFERGLITSVDDEEKCQNEREQSLPRETVPRPITHVHLRPVECHRGWFSRSIPSWAVLGKKDQRSLEVAAAVPWFWRKDFQSLPTFVSFVYVSMGGISGKYSAELKTLRRRGQQRRR